MEFTRTIQIERADQESESVYTFPMTLATQGEASDGHILSIGGGQIPERMPLLVAHMNHPGQLAGSVTDASKRMRAQPPELRAMGQIELEGDGEAAEVRRDLAHMIEQGHLSAVSVRWEPIKATPRRDLSNRHPAYVDADEPDLNRRYGLFFEEWRAVEGSVVPIGADPAAKIGRSEVWDGFFDFEATETPPLLQARNLISLGITMAQELSLPEEDLLRGIVQQFDGFTLGLECDEPQAEPEPEPVEVSLKPRTEQLTAEDLRSLLEARESRLKDEAVDLIKQTILGRRTGR